MGDRMKALGHIDDGDGMGKGTGNLLTDLFDCGGRNRQNQDLRIQNIVKIQTGFDGFIENLIGKKTFVAVITGNVDDFIQIASPDGHVMAVVGQHLSQGSTPASTS